MSDAAAYDTLAALEEAAAAAGVKLARCHFLQIQVGVLEREEVGATSDSWPAAIVLKVNKELAAWRARNPDRKVVVTRSYAIPGQCVVEIYHAHVDQVRAAKASAAAPPAAPHDPRACMRCGE